MRGCGGSCVGYSGVWRRRRSGVDIVFDPTSHMLDHVGCPTNHASFHDFGAACEGVCPDCGNKIEAIAESQMVSEDKRRQSAEDQIRTAIRGNTYCDFDRAHRDLCADVGVRADKKTVFTHKLKNFGQFQEIFKIFLLLFIQEGNREGGVLDAEVLADRMSYPEFLRDQGKAWTMESLLEYDRRMRKRGGSQQWSSFLDHSLVHLLVPITLPGSPEKGEKGTRGAKGARKGKGGKGGKGGKKDSDCHAAKGGEECLFWKKKGSCRFNHKCPVCQKDTLHVWADCK